MSFIYFSLQYGTFEKVWGLPSISLFISYKMCLLGTTASIHNGMEIAILLWITKKLGLIHETIPLNIRQESIQNYFAEKGNKCGKPHIFPRLLPGRCLSYNVKRKREVLEFKNQISEFKESGWDTRLFKAESQTGGHCR